MTWGACNDGLKGHPAMSLVARELLEDMGLPLDGWRVRARMHWPHPCYLGASYLNCGWAWIYECSEYGSVGEDECGGQRQTTAERLMARWVERHSLDDTLGTDFPHLC